MNFTQVALAMPETLKIVPAGYGYTGKTIHAPLVDSAPGLELVAVFLQI